jgi:hypothetical protein
MNHKAFQVVLDRRLKLISEVLGSKAKEYATEDRLHNFRRAASLLGVSSFKALAGMWSKHIVSVLDMIDNLGTKDFSRSYVDEKIGDSINYLILLEAMIVEQYQYDELNRKIEEKQVETEPTLAPQFYKDAEKLICPKCKSDKVRPIPNTGAFACTACSRYFHPVGI